MPDTTTTLPPASHAPAATTTQAPASSSPAQTTTQAPASSDPQSSTTAAPSGNGPAITGLIEVDPDDGNAQHPTSVQVRESATLTLTWNATNAEHVSIDGLGDSLGVSGSQSIPTRDATYTLTAIAADGTRSDPCQLMVSTHGDDEMVSPHCDVYPPGGPATTSTEPPNASTQPPTTTTQPPQTTTAPSSTTTAPPASSTTEPPSSTTGAAPTVISFLGYTPDVQTYLAGASDLQVDPDTNIIIRWKVSADAKEVMVVPFMNAPVSDVEGETSFTAKRDSDNPGSYTYTLTAKNDFGESAPSTVTVQARAAASEIDYNLAEWKKDFGELKGQYVTFKLSAAATPAVKFNLADPSAPSTDTQTLSQRVGAKAEAWLAANDTITQIQNSQWSIGVEDPKLTAQWTRDKGGKLSIDYALKLNPLGVALTTSAVLAAFDAEKNSWTIGSLEMELAKEYAVDVTWDDIGVKVTGSIKFALTGAAEPNWTAILKQMGAQVAIDLAITAGFIAGGVATIVAVWKGMEAGTIVRDAATVPDQVASDMANGVVAGFTGGSCPSGDDAAAGFKYGQDKLAEYKTNLKAQQPDATDDEVNQAATDAIQKYQGSIQGWAHDALLPQVKAAAWSRFAQSKDDGTAKDVWVALYGHLPASSNAGDAQYFKDFPDNKDFK